MEINYNISNSVMPRYEAKENVKLDNTAIQSLMRFRSDKQILVGLSRQTNGDFSGGVVTIPPTIMRNGQLITTYLHNFLAVGMGVRIGHSIRTRPHNLTNRVYRDITGKLKTKHVAEAITLNKELINTMLDHYTGKIPYGVVNAIGRNDATLTSENFVKSYMIKAYNKNIPDETSEEYKGTLKDALIVFFEESLKRKDVNTILGWVPAEAMPDFRFQLYGRRIPTEEPVVDHTRATIGEMLGTVLDSVVPQATTA